jgi:hypothetical protein
MNVARIRKIRNETKFWLGNLKERDHLEDLNVDGRNLKWILESFGSETAALDPH